MQSSVYANRPLARIKKICDDTGGDDTGGDDTGGDDTGGDAKAVSQDQLRRLLLEDHPFNVVALINQLQGY